MSATLTPKTRKSLARQIYEDLLSEDDNRRAQAIWVFRNLGPRGQRFLVQEATRSAQSPEKCIAALEALRRVGVPLDVDSFLDVHPMLQHQSRAVRIKVEDTLFALQHGDAEAEPGSHEVSPDDCPTPPPAIPLFDLMAMR
jgi:hypothetical protein